MKKFFSLFTLLLFCMVSVAQPKTVAILGDSYSTFEGSIPEGNACWYFTKNNPNNTDVNDVKQTWWWLLTERMGWTLLINNSYSGSTICNTGYNKEDYSDRSFIRRMDNLGGNPDVILIFGATNDSWAQAPIGEYNYPTDASGQLDIERRDLWTFRPAMAYMLAWMKEHYAKSDIFFILNDGLSDEITTSAKVICLYYGVRCIELKGIAKKAGHPSVEGMQQIANQVEQAVKQ